MNVCDLVALHNNSADITKNGEFDREDVKFLRLLILEGEK